MCARARLCLKLERVGGPSGEGCGVGVGGLRGVGVGWHSFILKTRTPQHRGYMTVVICSSSGSAL